MRYQGIKVTLITGFLGAGKTTLIRELLSQAPVDERWAVLVNEFGDIGLDSVFYSDLDVAITEVAGGCVCCTTSAAFQKGLNQLIRQHNPDRIFIEPSGLGHPRQILQKLRSLAYQDVLLLTGAFCVLDARNLNDERYTQHAIFNDQIACADGIVFSHVDCYQQEDIDRLKASFEKRVQANHKPALFMSHPMSLAIDKLDIGLNDVNTADQHAFKIVNAHHAEIPEIPSETRLVKFSGSLQPYHKQQDAMQVIGWQWTETQCFEQQGVTSGVSEMALLEGIYRIKGVFKNTSTSATLVNVSRGQLSCRIISWSGNSRIEIIGDAELAWAEKAQAMVATFLS